MNSSWKGNMGFLTDNLNLALFPAIVRELEPDYTEGYLSEVKDIVDQLDKDSINRMIQALVEIRERGGRLFFLGVGGSAANASHAVNDFRKICGFEAYTPVDNISELTARINDEGWEYIFVEWLKKSRLCENDGVFVLSVGGGNLEKNISSNLVRAVEFAKVCNAIVLGIVGRDGGFTARGADACVIIPPVNHETITPHTEAFQAVVWHLLTSHPALKIHETKWESTK
ncbi:MAG: SIS domain-containing protein [Candidatus Aminicenantales bacterium]